MWQLFISWISNAGKARKRCPRREKVNFESGNAKKKASSFRFKRQDIHTSFIRFRTEWLMYECMRNEKYSECGFTDPCYGRLRRVLCYKSEEKQL
jgi:hypothetical protein